MKEKNLIVVKVDNSRQPNSRWYSGSGIYRNIRLVTTNKISVDHWGTFITTPSITDKSAEVTLQVKILNLSGNIQSMIITTVIYDKKGNKVASTERMSENIQDTSFTVTEKLNINNPVLWSIENPHLYKAVTTIKCNGKECDDYETTFGVRYFNFDRLKGFSLNGKQLKIYGVCNHHDLGCLGATVNRRAIERQLELLKGMGVNGIRTSHNPPAPELLDLCDEMGFIVMDEAFDMWKKSKTEFDYALDWDEWHKRDLQDFILRDRNHPCVIMWSIGNEIPEQRDSSGIELTRELVRIVKELDTTRPITANCDYPYPDNYIIKSGALDVIGFSYREFEYPKFLDSFPGQKLIASETTSAIATRSYYDMPSDSIRIWPERWDKPFDNGNTGNTCSSYDNCRVPWGSTHQATWKLVKKLNYVSGLFIWTGFDYLGEPTPYNWPSRSSYFGILDLAGFPKDAYYLYKSEWTKEPVLHIFPHWTPVNYGANWKEGDSVDVWAYTNCEEVELFLYGNSLGIKRKTEDDLHLMWRVQYKPGLLKAIGRNGGKHSIVDEINTAESPAKIILEADRKSIKADGQDLLFITVKIVDESGTLAPNADNLIHFSISGNGKIVGVDNGQQTSLESFKVDYRKAFNGMCLVVIQATENDGKISLKASSDNLMGASITINTK